MGRLGDLLAAAVVLLGGGLLGGTLFPGPEFLGPAGAPPDLRPAILGSGGLGPVSADSPLGVLTLVVMPAPLMFVRRRWPLAVVLLTWAGYVAAVLLGLPSLAPGIALTIALHALAFRRRRSLVFAVAAVAAGSIVVLAFATTGWATLDPRVFQIGAAVAVAATLGDSARSRHAYLLQVEERARNAEQAREAEARRRVSEERLRIARDLHDTVAHQISVINLHAGAAAGQLAHQPEQARASLAAIREAARGALFEIGGLLRFLRDGEQAETGAAPHGLEVLDDLVARMRAAGLDVDVDARGDLTRVTGTTGHVAYRVVQEGLTNAHKHGDGRQARLDVAVEAAVLRIGIENPVPAGPAAARSDAAAAGSGLGLVGLRERVAAVHGTVSVEDDGARHRLDVELPLR